MKTFILIVLITLSIIMIIDLIGSFIFIKTGFGKKLYHDKMGWCRPNDKIGFNGCSLTSTCKYCHKRILQDSQGNWFAISFGSEEV